MKLARIALASLFALTVASAAFAGDKFGIQVTNGTANLYTAGQSAMGPLSDHYITNFDHSEIGVQVQMWHPMGQDYAIAGSAGFGFFGETDKPGKSAPATALDFVYSQRSVNVRAGVDRLVKVGERTSLYFGPGLEYWSGSSKFDTGDAATTWESGKVSRISLSGRIGAIMHVTDKVGFDVQLGRKVGLASATDDGRKISFWPSSFDAACGLILSLAK